MYAVHVHPWVLCCKFARPDILGGLEPRRLPLDEWESKSWRWSTAKKSSKPKQSGLLESEAAIALLWPCWAWPGGRGGTMKCPWKDNSKQKVALDFLFQNQSQELWGKQTEMRSFVRHRFFSRWESGFHENDRTSGAWHYLCSPLKLG